MEKKSVRCKESEFVSETAGHARHSVCVTGRRALVAVLLATFLAATAGAFTQPDQNTAPGTEDVCLSLRVLAKHADDALAKGLALGGEETDLAGIGWMEGYMVDPSTADIILVGCRSADRPVLHLDDLAAVLHNLMTKDAPPYCSLDPLPENVLEMQRVMAVIAPQAPGNIKNVLEQLEQAVGPQQTVIGGVSREARMAHVMIEADYHMKKVSQGFVSVPGVSSTLDRIIAAAQAAVDAGKEPQNSGITQSRFWFHIKKDAAAAFSTAADIVWLESCPIGLLTERQRSTAEGRLYDSGETDPWGEAFAAEMSVQFVEVAQSVPAYADLENLFRLRALCSAMFQRGDIQKAGIELGYFRDRHSPTLDMPMPDSLPGLANAKEWSACVEKGNTEYHYSLAPIICGGVSMDTPVSARQFRPDKTGVPKRVKEAALVSRPDPDALAWPVPRQRRAAASVR